MGLLDGLFSGGGLQAQAPGSGSGGGFMDRLTQMQQTNPEAFIALGAGLMRGDMAGGVRQMGQAVGDYRGDQRRSNLQREGWDRQDDRFAQSHALDQARFDNTIAAQGTAQAQEQQQLNQTLKWAESTGDPDVMGLAGAGMFDEAFKVWNVKKNGGDLPTSVQEFLYGQKNPDFLDYKRSTKGGVNVNVGDGAPELGKLSTDYGYLLDPETRQPVIDPSTNLPMSSAIPGSPAWQDQQQAQAKAAASAGSRQTSTDTVTTAAQRARDALTGGMPATGTVGNIMANLPESNAAEIRRQTEVLQATAKFDNLQMMRANSPTGGALGNVSDAEGAMLAAKSGALDPSSPNFLRDVDDYERTLLRVIHGPAAGDAIYQQTRSGAPQAQRPANPGANRTSNGLNWSVQ
ncbi:hypothetical protein [Aurantimonas sp. A3-2-R12]|uniref:hypothetical protein n=1 Tax=Aurantimonas sp. A3-2-R12 TaxID=3114362 RepID=UPI002E175F82|nr:hypothetical protein [Aurantimonas sp. A3-2-R12]